MHVVIDDRSVSADDVRAVVVDARIDHKMRKTMKKRVWSWFCQRRQARAMASRWSVVVDQRGR